MRWSVPPFLPSGPPSARQGSPRQRGGRPGPLPGRVGRAVALGALLLGLGLGSASHAQTPADEPAEATAEPAPETDAEGEILRDREGRRYQLVRPEAGPRRGRLPVPEWVVWAGGGTLLLAAGVVLVRRVAKRS